MPSTLTLRLGDKYKHLTVVSRATNDSRGHARWLCICDCGIERICRGSSLLNGEIKNCGNHKTSVKVGDRYSRLLVIKRVNNDFAGNSRWLCRCDCGKEIITWGIHLPSGNTKSCGCLQREAAKQVNYRHGQYLTKEYASAAAKKRKDRLSGLRPNNYREIEKAVREFFTSCVVCGISEEEHLKKYNTRLHVDHIHPVSPVDGSKGRGMAPNNVCVLCISCNSTKHNLLLSQLEPSMRKAIKRASKDFERYWNESHE